MFSLIKLALENKIIKMTDKGGPETDNQPA
jgi:hypothetical protein